MNNDITLRFKQNGKFRILCISDFHLSKNTNLARHYTDKLIKGIDVLIEETHPDFVMIGGDQCIDRETPEEVREYMCEVLEPVLKRNLPWAAIFGNHDRETGINIKDEMKIYKSIPGCLSEEGPEDIFGTGNFTIPVLSSKNDSIAYNLWAFDSGRVVEDCIDYFGLDKDTKIRLPHHFNEGQDGSSVLFDQVMWYYNESVKYEKENGRKIPGVMFMHIPLPEYLQVLRNPEECNAMGSKREAPGCCELNSGLFMAALQRGDIKGIFFGHEHLIDIQGEYCGITLACDAAIGYNMSCHDDLRGGRVIDLYEDGGMETHNVKLIDLMGVDAMREPGYFEGGCRYHIRTL